MRQWIYFSGTWIEITDCYVKRTEPKAFDELPVSKLLNYLTRDNIIELIGFPNFSNLNEQVKQQTGKQFWIRIMDDATSIHKYLAANTKVNDLTRQQQSKQVSWLMSRPKKQFLGCVAKHTPPEYKIIPYSGLRNSAYEKELNAGHTNRATVLKPPPGMKILHLPKGIREYVSRNPSEFKDYLDEISAETKRLDQMQETESEEGFYKLQRIQYYQLLHFTMTQWWNFAYNDMVSQLPQSIVDCLKHRIQNTKIRGKKCELNEESENLKRLFERELTIYSNKKQSEIKKVQVECTSKTMSLELQLEEMHKTLEQRDKFITK
ncbi:hypothetical protein PROFUN_14414 [Planoprotostelium fungivorum]|uniref:Uncharacterized protein n=1 Tax=Planoprotostelium fungivorum TaxID=1890364 RepID=A0A2P6MX83_9EUKA|nr:hypothetical protein PROFUN_14414 [Planoprotostelium fungivorum]